MKSTDEIMQRVAEDAERARAKAMAKELDMKGVSEQGRLEFGDELARLIDAYFRHTVFDDGTPRKLRLRPEAVKDE